MIVQVENPIVEIHALTVCYDKKPILWNVDCSFKSGSLIGIIGPNGAGKSTLIKAIMQIIPISSGYVKIMNQALPKVRNKISYIPQKESIDWTFPISVLEVVLMGRYNSNGLFKRRTKEDYEIAHQSLIQVEMQDFHKKQISELSGGQQQRVFIARALAQQPEIYFMDEPFSGIDSASEEMIIRLLKELRNKGKTIFVIHHDLQSITGYFDWVTLLNSSLMASGPTEKVFTPELLKKTYVGKLTTLDKITKLIEEKRFPVREKP